MKPFVTQVWPQFTADQQFCAAFGSVIVDRVELYRTQRQVVICLRSAEPLDQALCGRLCASLAEVFAGYELQVRSYFAYPNITPEAVRLMIEELKEKGMPVNGFLDKSEPVTFGEDGITVHVSAGRQILESVELPRVLAEMIQERTGSLPVVRLADSGKARTEEEFEQYLQEKAPVVKFEAKETPPDFTIEGLALTNKPVKLFYGKQFKPTDTRRLNDLGDGGKVTVWGDVFATEVKGSRRKIYFTSITDYSGSVNLKVMGEEGADMSKWEGLKPGTTLIVRGNYMYDKYEHDFVIMPYDVLQVEREQRQDTAPDGEKRVELHLHTKSSSMDGFNDPGKIVRLAHRMGHRAIAITDHGVCQGYPEAMLATDAIHETDPNFKLIYGCEAYFVDDMIPAVYGSAEMPLSGSFVVFDTETTGLDSNTERLTEIGAVYVENGKINEEKKFCTFVNPGKPIPQKVVDLTGINDAMVADAPTPEEAIRAFKEFCGDNILVAHNAHSFDMLFIRKAGEKAVGMVARLEEVKDHETFLLGAKKLLEKRQDVRFYIVGDGSLRKQLEQKAAALGIREHVTFTGFLQDVEKIEAALDIAVITSKAEALCLSILESMIAGIPAVGTDSGGVAEVIRHGENGFLIPVGDSDALAERLDELLADDAKRSAFGAQAKRDAEATFLAEQMTRKIEKLYLEAGK